MEQEHDDKLTERMETAAEHYWLQGMDLGYAKRRAHVELTRGKMVRGAPKFPVVQLGQ